MGLGRNIDHLADSALELRKVKRTGMWAGSAFSHEIPDVAFRSATPPS